MGGGDLFTPGLKNKAGDLEYFSSQLAFQVNRLKMFTGSKRTYPLNVFIFLMVILFILREKENMSRGNTEMERKNSKDQPRAHHRAQTHNP